jgi:shikimate kinase
VPAERTIVIIGMMGSGKTTVGRLLGERLDVAVVDNDELIAEASGRPNEEHLRAEPEAWRRLEADMVEKTLRREAPVVFSLGGGAVMTESTAALLRSADCTVVWLRAEPEVLLQRVAAAPGTRPMLDGDAVERMRTLLEQRTATYRQLADVEIDASVSVGEVVERILEAL